MKSQERSARDFVQIEVWKLQESSAYFKIFKPTSWGKRPVERRGRLIQRFPNLFLGKTGRRGGAAEMPLTAALPRLHTRRRLVANWIVKI